jgi:hypothetical protein
MNVFQSSKVSRVMQICDSVRTGKSRVRMTFLIKAAVAGEDPQAAPDILVAKNLDISPSLMANPTVDREGILHVFIHRNACPELIIDDQFVIGYVSVNKAPCYFKVPIGCILQIEDLTLGLCASFEVDMNLFIGENQPVVEEVAKPKPHLRVVE